MRSLLVALAFAPLLHAAERPNIVWIVGEDLGMELGCYGDPLARTPHLDRLAAQGTRFSRCYTHCPVCAPSRSGLITGMYPTTIGTHHMRSTLLKPPPTFTHELRKAGYHVSWPGKTDFNFAVPKDAFDSTTDWLREFPKSRPFFAYVNFTVSHESQIRASAEQHAKNTNRLAADQRQDPAKFTLPPYYPDTPAVRNDFKQYYEIVTAVDHRVGDVLRVLEQQGVADNTIVFFFGDHGRGLPRSKRWVYEQGTHVPLLVRWPGKLKPGSLREDLVSFIDLPATALALAGVEIPPRMQGNVFLGPKATERKYAFHHRDRMDETYDRIRSVRDRRFQYVRNFHPELPYAQRVQYMELMPTMRDWRRLNEEGKLNEVQRQFFAKTKPAEELYDIQEDPHCVRNLAESPAHREKLLELRGELERWMESTKDLGSIPEKELIQRGLVADRLKEYESRKP